MGFQPMGGDDEPILADINVTPLVDVMLVLLIIFMVAAPMLHQGVEVKLPQADSLATPPVSDRPIVLTVNRDGLVYLDDTPIHPSQLVERLLPIVESRPDETVYLKGDEAVPYGQIVAVIDLLRQGGVSRLSLVTEERRRR